LKTALDMKNISHLLVLGLLMLVLGCSSDPSVWKAKADQPEYLHRSMKKVTDVIVHDIFSPPVASRIYAYVSIAGYEALLPEHPEYASYAGQLRDFTPVPQPQEGEDYCYPCASSFAMLAAGKTLIFSETKIAEFVEEIREQMATDGVPESVIERSKAYGEAVAMHVLAWADEDNYNETRTMPKYTIKDEGALWRPTPPDYMDGIEPHWRKIRPFVLDSATQFVPAPPTPFSMDPDSRFYEETMEVYNALEANDREERIEIAKFWDCNPYVSTHSGHVMFATKKITPGGHWIGITEIACKDANASVMQTAEAYSMVSIALADAFISCWDEKYRSNLVRPETVINTHIDQDWRPTLQTPPFPEHTSGHSVISRSAAITLTDLFGDNFAFNDTVEEEYGLPARQFESFLQASEEAAVSRLYGGIHYRPAIDYGVQQGEQVGKFIVQQVETRKSSLGLK
jgi:hypothetical protein